MLFQFGQGETMTNDDGENDDDDETTKDFRGNAM
jgi:hypothetical protein